MVNFFNFLDGIDGLAAVQAVVTAAGIALAGWDPFAALLAAALAGATAGFLPYNWSRASIFLGDVGSYFLGYTLATLPLAAPPASRPQAVLFVALSLWLFLADAAWTLVRRARSGAPWYAAHREHLYQQLALRLGPWPGGGRDRPGLGDSDGWRVVGVEARGCLVGVGGCSRSRFWPSRPSGRR